MMVRQAEKLIEVKLVCPNSLNAECPKEKNCWKCTSCKQTLQYGFDRMLYCKCGTAPLETYSFRCDSDKHREFYVPFTKTLLDDLESKLPLVCYSSNV